MTVCVSCAEGKHYCAGDGCPCFCDAPDAYWAPDAHVCDICECCEEDLGPSIAEDLGPSIVTIELPGISR